MQAHGASNTTQEINGVSHAAADHCYIDVDRLLTQFKSLPHNVELSNGNYLFFKNEILFHSRPDALTLAFSSRCF